VHARVPLEESRVQHHSARQRHGVLPHVTDPKDLNNVTVENSGIVRRIPEDGSERYVECNAILTSQGIALSEGHDAVD